jgi:hypothetical protein
MCKARALFLLAVVEGSRPSGEGGGGGGKRCVGVPAGDGVGLRGGGGGGEGELPPPLLRWRRGRRARTVAASGT